MRARNSRATNALFSPGNPARIEPVWKKFISSKAHSGGGPLGPTRIWPFHNFPVVSFDKQSRKNPRTGFSDSYLVSCYTAGSVRDDTGSRTRQGLRCAKIFTARCQG